MFLPAEPLKHKLPATTGVRETKGRTQHCASHHAPCIFVGTSPTEVQKHHY